MLLRRKVPKVTSLRARPHARARESAHLTDTVREPAIEERLIGWPAAIIYLRKHESPATAPSSEGNAQDGLTQKVSSLLFPYLRAWTDQAEIGDPAFDECATVESLADLLAARVVRLLRTEI